MKHDWMTWQPSRILKGQTCTRCTVARIARLVGGHWKSEWEMAPGEGFKVRTTAPRCRRRKATK